MQHSRALALAFMDNLRIRFFNRFQAKRCASRRQRPPYPAAGTGAGPGTGVGPHPIPPLRKGRGCPPGRSVAGAAISRLPRHRKFTRASGFNARRWAAGWTCGAERSSTREPQRPSAQATRAAFSWAGCFARPLQGCFEQGEERIWWQRLDIQVGVLATQRGQRVGDSGWAHPNGAEEVESRKRVARSEERRVGKEG